MLVAPNMFFIKVLAVQMKNDTNYLLFEGKLND